MDQAKRLLNKTELGIAIGVHPRTILLWRKQGLPAIKISYKNVKYDLEEVVAWLKEKAEKNKEFDIPRIDLSPSPSEEIF